MELLAPAIVFIAAVIAMTINQTFYCLEKKKLKKEIYTKSHRIIQQAETILYIKKVRDTQRVHLSNNRSQIIRQNYILAKMAAGKGQDFIDSYSDQFDKQKELDKIDKYTAKKLKESFNQPRPEFRDLKTIVSQDPECQRQAAIIQQQQAASVNANQALQAQAMNRNRRQGGSIFGP
jgi:hypothetical protein